MRRQGSWCVWCVGRVGFCHAPSAMKKRMFGGSTALERTLSNAVPTMGSRWNARGLELMTRERERERSAHSHIQRNAEVSEQALLTQRSTRGSDYPIELGLS